MCAARGFVRRARLRALRAASCAGYYDEIKNPMDLATIRTKLRRRGGGAGGGRVNGSNYVAAGEWLADVRLMLANALRYNRAQVGARVHLVRGEGRDLSG